MTTLQVENLTYTYNRNTPFYKDAVKDISFSVENGEIIGIIGHTGSGKSTLVQHLNGLIKPDSGRILFCGKDIWEEPKKIKEIRSKIGLVFQYPEYQLFDETVFKDIAFGPKNMGIDGDELNKVVLDTAELVGIPASYFERSPFDLSGGEKRRVAIAGVLAMQPQVIVFDEPTAGLDPAGRETVIEIIKNYRKTKNATVFIVSHSMEDMAVLADRIIVMNKGSLAMFDTPQNVFSRREELQSYGLDVPMVTQVICELRKRGVNLGKGIITIEQAVEALCSLGKGGAVNVK